MPGKIIELGMGKIALARSVMKLILSKSYLPVIDTLITVITSCEYCDN